MSIHQALEEEERGQARLPHPELIRFELPNCPERHSRFEWLGKMESLMVGKAGLPPLFRL
jgi:hypothetical protein